MDAIKEMKTKCEGVVQFTDDLLSGANTASSTTATGKRRKRSNVPYFCDDLLFELEAIKTSLQEGNQTGQIYAAYNISALRKRCNYTLSSRLTLDDCAAQNASLHAVKDDLKGLFADLDKVT